MPAFILSAWAWVVAKGLAKYVIWALVIIGIGLTLWGTVAFIKHEQKVQDDKAAVVLKMKTDNEALKAEVTATNIQLAKQKKAGDDLEAQLTAQRDANAKLAKDMQNEVRQNPIYTTCRVPANGLRLYNAARRGTGAAAR